MKKIVIRNHMKTNGPRSTWLWARWQA